MVNNLVIIPHNTIDAIVNVVTVDNLQSRAVSAHKLKKIPQILEGNGYNFWTSLDTITWEDNGVSFTDKDIYCVFHPYFDPVIIFVFIDTRRIERILFDEGSVSTILYAIYQNNMDLSSVHIIKDTQLVSSFDGTKLQPYGYILLPICLAEKTFNIVVWKRLDHSYANRCVGLLSIS